MAKVLNIKNFSYRIPYGAIYVGRSVPRYNLPASKWGNPYKIGRHGNREEVIAKFRKHCEEQMKNGFVFDLHELRGKDLVCWCSPLPCHADVLLEMANK